MTTHVPNSTLDSRLATLDSESHPDRQDTVSTRRLSNLHCPPCALQHTCCIRLLLFSSVKTLHCCARLSILNYKSVWSRLHSIVCKLASKPHLLFVKNTQHRHNGALHTSNSLNQYFLGSVQSKHVLTNCFVLGPNPRAASPKRKVRQGAGVSHGQVRRSDQEASQGDAQGSYFACLDWLAPLLIPAFIRKLPIDSKNICTVVADWLAFQNEYIHVKRN